MGSKYHLQKLLRLVSTTHLTTSSLAFRPQDEALGIAAIAQKAQGVMKKKKKTR